MKKLSLIIGCAALLVSCGGEEKEVTTETEAPVEAVEEVVEEVVEEEAPLPEGPTVTVELSSDDKMMYDKKEISVRAGQEVTVVLKHTGSYTIEAMGHNFVLLQQGVDLAAFAQSVMELKDSQFIPEDKSDIIAHTGLIGGGEETSVTFMAPEAGEYEFLCTFPGHYSMMKGKFIVVE